MENEITIENYDEKRRELLELNSNKNGVILNEKELRLNEYLTRLKKEFKDTYSNAASFSVLRNKELRDTELYKFCHAVPKGADLHVHDMALLPFEQLTELLLTCPEMCIKKDKNDCSLAVVPPEETPSQDLMRFSEAIESGYYTKDELLESWTAIGAEKAGMGVWDYFETIFARHGVLSDNPDFALKYYRKTFRYYCENNVIHIEIHIMLTESIESSIEYVKMMRQAYYDVKKDYPYFTVRIIGAGVKADNETVDFTRKCFLNAACVSESVKDEFDPECPRDFLVGFDLVNEEDKSLPLKAFVPMLLKVKKQFPGMKLYIHGGESLDASNENLIDAYLLGVSRVGHGFNLYRYPDLHRRYINSEICLEVCPVSNQILGYAKDLRNHPAVEYLKTGLMLSLCSDDPTYMENESLTDDFFAALIAWDLSVADIKQLAVNSIMFSALDRKTKYASLRAFKNIWNDFLDLNF